jgi:hypothetical protein
MFILFLTLSTLAQAHTPAPIQPQEKTLSAVEIKRALCPFSAKRAKGALAHESLEHGGLEDLRRSLNEQLRQYGKCQGMEEIAPQNYELIYPEVRVPLEVIYGPEGKIRTYFFGMPRHANDSPSKLKAELRKLSYRFSFLAVEENGKELIEHEAASALNVSRSNQIFILAEAATQLKEGKIKRSDSLALARARAVQTMGTIFSWRDGTLVTIDSLLNLMIAERDLAAADLLLEALGQKNLARLGKELSPFLSYREFFLLTDLDRKSLDSPKKVEAQRAALDSKPLPEIYRLDRLDLIPVLGWFASPREICKAALSVKEDLIDLNAALAKEYANVQPKKILKFGIVQTRDSGISQVTAVYKTASSPWTCLAITANHKDEIEEGTFSGLYARLLNLALQSQAAASKPPSSPADEAAE